jgi:hypothetical protein
MVKYLERHLYRFEEVLACSQERLSAVGLHFRRLVELCSGWKWKFG